MTTKTSALQFASWLKAEHPALYRRAKMAADRAVQQKAQLSGLGESDEAAKKPWYQTFFQTVATAGTTLLQLKAQKSQLETNLKRAEQGLPPVTYADTGPTIRTQVNLEPDVVDKITSSAGSNINKVLLFGALGLLAWKVLG